MKRLIVIVLLGFLAWQGYAKYQSTRTTRAAPQGATEAMDRSRSPNQEQEATPTGQYKCDGRTYCSQMTSCAEATFFLKNCPGVKMDGNNDGVPCEKQWCK